MLHTSESRKTYDWKKKKQMSMLNMTFKLAEK